jgi:hypothetical protein
MPVSSFAKGKRLSSEQHRLASEGTKLVWGEGSPNALSQHLPSDVFAKIVVDPAAAAIRGVETTSKTSFICFMEPAAAMAALGGDALWRSGAADQSRPDAEP